jgi:hypothetical protein
MKASELITLLQGAIDKYGDLDIEYAGEFGPENCNEVVKNEFDLDANYNDIEEKPRRYLMIW